MSFSQKRRRIKPFARPTSFDINVAFDLRHYQHVKFGKVINPLFPTAANDEAFHALEGEILMQNSSPGVRRYGDHQMHVFSFANGLQGSDLIEGQPGPRGGDAVNVNSNAPKKARLLNGLKYAGVAVTDFSPEKDVFERVRIEIHHYKHNDCRSCNHRTKSEVALHKALLLNNDM